MNIQLPFGPAATVPWTRKEWVKQWIDQCINESVNQATCPWHVGWHVGRPVGWHGCLFRVMKVEQQTKKKTPISTFFEKYHTSCGTVCRWGLVGCLFVGCVVSQFQARWRQVRKADVSTDFGLWGSTSKYQFAVAVFGVHAQVSYLSICCWKVAYLFIRVFFLGAPCAGTMFWDCFSLVEEQHTYRQRAKMQKSLFSAWLLNCRKCD